MELLERTPLLSELGALLREAASGRGALALVGAEAGGGKSALVGRFCAEARGSARILVGACDPLATPRPLGPLLDIAAATGGEIGRLVHASARRDRLFGAFLAELATGPKPALVVVEDVHWADEATLDLVRFLGRRIARIPALLVVTYRDDEVGPVHPLRLVLGDLATTADVRRLDLSPLSVEAVRALTVGSAIDPVSLHHQTGGNPFFVTEVLGVGGGGIPQTVRDAVLARAARLSPAGRATVEAAAVIGGQVPPALLGEVVLAPRRPAAARYEAAEECIAGGMLCAVGRDLAFRHELAREAILDGIAPPRRIRLHARVLAALRATPAPDPTRLAHHAEEAGDGEAVLEYAPAAAKRAAALGAHREAAAHYARALRFADQLPPERRGALLQARAQECYLTDQMAEAIVACEEALAIWRQAGDRLREGDAQRRLARLLWFSGRGTQAEAAGRAALELLEPLPPGAPLAMAYGNHAAFRLAAWDQPGAIAWGERAIALAESLNETETLVHALNTVGMARLAGGDERGRDDLERSLDLARATGLEEHAARAFSNLGVGAVAAYRFAQADRYLDAGIAYCVEHDLDHQRFYMLAWSALSRFYQGRWGEAADLALAVTSQPMVSPVSRIMALVALGRVEIRRGDPAGMTALDEALALAEQTGELQRLAPVRAARAEAAWLAGDRARVAAEARDVYREVLDHRHSWLLGELAVWLWRVGELDSLPPDVLEPFALQLGGDWAAAAATWHALGCPYEEAQALIDGDEAALRAAHAEFTRLDAGPAAAIASRRLRELGARDVPRGPRPATQAHPAHLTQREAEILALIEEGRRNAEIAERLFLSPRTVAHHISSILAKLGAQSRTEAVREAARRGLLGQGGTSSNPT